jgi:outer membrane protein assembly factor BamB
LTLGELKMQFFIWILFLLLIFPFSLYGYHNARNYILNHEMNLEGIKENDQSVINTSFTIEQPKALKKDWKFKSPEIISSPPILWGDYVYFCSGTYFEAKNRFLFCIQKDTGKLRWKFEFEDIRIQYHIISGDNVFVKAENHDKKYIYCFNTNNGKLEWKYGFTDVRISAPIASGECVYIGVEISNEKDYILCLNKISGKVRWKFHTYGLDMLNSHPVIHEDNIYIGKRRLGDYYRGREITDKGQMICISKKTGALIWAVMPEDKGFSDTCPLVKENYIYIGSKSDYFCLNKDTGELIWKFEMGGRLTKVPPVVEDNFLFVVSTIKDSECLPLSEKGFIYCLDRITGELKWKFEAEGFDGGYSSPTISKDHFYLNALIDKEKGAVFCLDINTGELKWQFENIDNKFSSTNPVIFGDYVYCSGILGKQGYVFCLDKYTGELIKKLPTGNKIPFNPAITNGRIFIVTRDKNVVCYIQGNFIHIISNYITLILLMAPGILVILFGILQDQMHALIERWSGSPDYHKEQRYQNRLEKLYKIIPLVHGLSRTLSGGSNLIVINLYLGWLLLLTSLLAPIAALYMLFILIPFDPWLPKFWPYSIYGLYIGIIAWIIYVT